ncbi:MAG: lysophospholipid acyltransferase family protein, partial [Planctomycetota bacterium]
MNIQTYQTPPRWWSPKLSPWGVKCCVPLRRIFQFKIQRVLKVEIRGIEYLKNILEDDCGILITPNHSCHADPLVLYRISDKVKRPFYFMAAWHVFATVNVVRQIMLRWHGCFSVDREGTDMRAFRQSVEILQNTSNPLVIFPEGEIYHINDQVTPFRDGPAAIALTAKKRSKRPVICIPCAVKYKYIQDPTPELIELMGQLEKRILWRPRPDLPLPERIYRLAGGLLGLKELEYLGRTQEGLLPDRISTLAETILQRLQERYRIKAEEAALPVRVKMCRREAIKQLELENKDDLKHEQAMLDLDDLFIVTQLFSYPGTYVASKPTIERMAETLDKFEEDVLTI